jgi:hypothetical protein
MEADDLKKLWGNSKVPKVTMKTLSLKEELDKEFGRFERIIIRRDRREIIAAIAVIIFTLTGAYFIVLPITAKIIILLLIPHALFYIYDIKKENQYKVTDMNLNFKESIKRQRIYYSRQRDLLNAIWFKHLVPVAVLNMLFYIALEMPVEKLIFRGVFITILYGAIYALNKWAVYKQLNPLIRKLDDILSEIDRGESATEQIEKL